MRGIKAVREGEDRPELFFAGPIFFFMSVLVDFKFRTFGQSS